MDKWYVYAKKADFKGISERFGIDQVTARILRRWTKYSCGGIWAMSFSRAVFFRI